MPTLTAASPCRPAWCTAGAADMICRPASSTRPHFFPITMRKLSCPSRREASDHRQHLVWNGHPARLQRTLRLCSASHVTWCSPVRYPVPPATGGRCISNGEFITLFGGAAAAVAGRVQPARSRLADWPCSASGDATYRKENRDNQTLFL